MSSLSDEIDQQIRLKAFEHIANLPKVNGLLHYTQLDEGFTFDNDRITLHNRQKGIHKPWQMMSLLSVKTVFPKSLVQATYRDQIDIYNKIYEGVDELDYSFMGADPNARENQYLLEAYKNNTPIIYFIGTGKGYYLPEFPVFLSDWNPNKLEVKINIDRLGDWQNLKIKVDEQLSTYIERKYRFSNIKTRLHQSRFRTAVMEAYDYKCAISGFPEPRRIHPEHKVPLIDVAHIVEDKNPKFGQPEIVNGLPLTKLHHAAYDANLIGIDPDYGLHLSRTLTNAKDGQTLALLKSIEGKKLLLPKNRKNFPDPERLSIKFQEFENFAR